MNRWIGGIVVVGITLAAVTAVGLQRDAHDVRPAVRSFTAPALPVDESALLQHCIGVVARQMQLSRLQLRKAELTPALRATYRQRRESAWAFAGVLGLMDGKAGAIREYQSSEVAYQYGLMRTDRPGEMLVTAPEQARPESNEEALWEREQWCERNLLDPSTRE